MTYPLDTKDFLNYVNNPSFSHLPKIIPLYSLNSSFISILLGSHYMFCQPAFSYFLKKKCSPRKCSNSLPIIFWFSQSLLTILIDPNLLYEIDEQLTSNCLAFQIFSMTIPTLSLVPIHTSHIYLQSSCHFSLRTSYL